MTKIKIATDSTADIPRALAEELGIAVLPLTVLAEGKEYRDGIDLTAQEFYALLERSETLPVSSQVASWRYLELYDAAWREGCTDLIQVTLNARGSGTYQAAVLSRDLFFEEHPDAAAQLRIHIIDSGTYSMAYGIAVIRGAKLLRQGAEVEAILAEIRDWLTHARPVFVPLELKCVKRSGRVSAAAAFVGDAMGLKPLITFENGESRILSKARGENKAIAALVETCLRERRAGTDYALVYGSNAEAYEKLKTAWGEVADQPPLVEYPVGSIIAINTGANMVAIIYRT